MSSKKILFAIYYLCTVPVIYGKTIKFTDYGFVAFCTDTGPPDLYVGFLLLFSFVVFFCSPSFVVFFCSPSFVLMDLMQLIKKKGDTCDWA